MTWCGQERLQTTTQGGNKHTKERQRSTSAVHASHVPHPGSLACEAQLQGLLACKDRHHELQLQTELHPVDTRRTAPQSQQHHPSLQLRLQASHRLRIYKWVLRLHFISLFHLNCWEFRGKSRANILINLWFWLRRWHRYVLRNEVLQWSTDGSRATRKCPVRSATSERQEHIYIQTRMGVSKKSILQWRWMYASPTWQIPISAKLRPSESSSLVNICDLHGYIDTAHSEISLEADPFQKIFESKDIRKRFQT